MCCACDGNQRSRAGVVTEDPRGFYRPGSPATKNARTTVGGAKQPEAAPAEDSGKKSAPSQRLAQTDFELGSPSHALVFELQAGG